MEWEVALLWEREGLALKLKMSNKDLSSVVVYEEIVGLP